MSLLKICNVQKLTAICQNRTICTTPVYLLDQRWRKQRGKPLNPNAYGVLTDTPDYTFLNGKPTPLGNKAQVRLHKRREIAQRIITLSKEIDFAVERHKKIQEGEQRAKDNIINSKLKAKGDLLLKGS